MGNKLLDAVQTLADTAVSFAKEHRKPGEAMQCAQATLNIAKAVEALVGSGCRLRDPDDAIKGNGNVKVAPAAVGDAQERPYVLRDLLEERNAIQRLALEWGDRWLAESPVRSFAGVYPITFDRAKAAERLYGCGERKDAGLSMNECRAKVGLGPI